MEREGEIGKEGMREEEGAGQKKREMREGGKERRMKEQYRKGRGK
jgi:hypothetical protein